MNRHQCELRDFGYTVVPDLISVQEQHCAREACRETFDVGDREMLRFSWCRELADSVKRHPVIGVLLPESAIAVQCTLFQKTEEANWLVAGHRDVTVPVKRKFVHEGWSAWSKKGEIDYVQPPRSVLETLLSVRVHLEENTPENGPLRVVPGSHRDRLDHSADSGAWEECPIPERGALVMRPLLFHASSKVSSGTRRVLHFLYGPGEWLGAE